MNLSRLVAIIICSLCLFSCRNKSLFESISSKHSNITFNNLIIENDSINELDIENVYNGGGVGVADFNKDGLQDLYFTGNVVSNKLYLNKGDFTFADITDEAGVHGEGRWSRGVAVVDINNDGWQDLYISVTLDKNPAKRENLLYINQGVDKNNIPHFKETATEYGLNDRAHSTQAAFFDYDNDGDLDVYVVTNEINKNVFPDVFHEVIRDGSNPSTGKLFQNEWNDSLQHPFFTDVSKKAGIQTEGYGHSINILDINRDGWKDIYVTNDFVSNDLLWINNHDGSFSEQLSTYFKHTSANAMGTDVADINNDGLDDVIALDMNPEDNYRKKMMMNANSYQRYQNSAYYGYNFQYVKNTLQLNQGPRVGQMDSIGVPVFSEIGFLSGIAETDWSWTPLVIDFDNDGNRDMIVTNGFPKDVTDHDFMTFRSSANQIASKEQILSQIPEVKLHNYAFRNAGNLSFQDVSDKWGVMEPSFSNGAVYADLDNDGDLDLVINNINDEALLYKNNLREQDEEESHFVQIKLTGDSLNRDGLGAWIEIYYGNHKKQVWENTPYRGYLSTVQGIAHFGLGKESAIDSLIIEWPNGTTQLLQNIKADQLLQVTMAGNQPLTTPAWGQFAQQSLFREITDSLHLNVLHEEKDFADFNIQKLLPHKLSEYGPALAVGDLDGNGLDDLVMGGAFSYSTQVFFQQTSGSFLAKNLLPGADIHNKMNEDMGILLFDADQDGDLDLYVTSGGYENPPNSNAYQDKFYINDGAGNFSADSMAIPGNLTSKFCIRAADFDKDNDLDLFISGRVDPWNYPKPVSSFIYRNDSKDSKPKFTDVSSEVAKGLQNIGLVCDALFTDFNNDGWQDLILAGEWMPITFFKNDHGRFTNVTAETHMDKQVGWWNTIGGGDFDNDGDMDYVIGNVGLNTFYKATDEYPVSIYAKDFDNNNSYDAFPSIYLPATQQDQRKREFPVHTRDDAVKQMISMRSKFQNYRSFAQSTMDQVFTTEQLKGALILRANNFQSSYCRNDGNGKFTLVPLPVEAQVSVLNGMTIDDFDADGNIDVLLNGNDFGTEVSVGRFDALNGLLLKGDGKGNFTPQTILQSGIYIPENGKALVKLRSASGKYLLAATQNRGPLKVFESKLNSAILNVQTDELYAEIKYSNGLTRKEEIPFGSSFLSQSARYIAVSKNVSSVILYNSKGKTREIQY